MRRIISVFALAAAFALAGLQAGPITYAVTANTSGIGPGYLDFQLSAGGPAQDLFVTISGLNIAAGQLGTAILDGDAAGTFPGPITMSNIPGFSGVFQQVLSFPNTLNFLLTFSGPALDSPDPAALFGTKFGLAILDSGFNPALTPTDIDGFNVTIDIGPGAFRSALASGPVTVVTPEPGTALTAGIAVLALILWRLRQRA